MNRDREVICPLCKRPVTVPASGRAACWNCGLMLVI